MEERLEAEARDALGRGYHEHGAAEGRGHRNGYRTGRLKSVEGEIAVGAPRIAGREEPFRSELRERFKGRTEALEDMLRDDDGRLPLSRTAVSELGEQLWRDCREFATRDPVRHEIAYLFVDGIAERIRPGRKREPVPAAWGFTEAGKRVLPHLQAGSKEDAETVSAFFQDMRSRGPGDPLPVVSDGAPGSVKAIETRFPRSARQRCLVHRMRNLAAKVPEHPWPEVKERMRAACQAPSRAVARTLAAEVVVDHDDEPPTAVACFMDDFEACIAHPRMPIVHHRAIRTTNPLERLFVEERRRTEIIPNAFGERAVLKLMFGAMVRAADRWRSIGFTEFERRRIAAIREELDKEHETDVNLAPSPAPRKFIQQF